MTDSHRKIFDFHRNRAKKEGLYDPANEHDACGVGFMARLDGKPTHKVISDALLILQNLEHRGALGGDRSTGDGAGILLRLPDAFFRNKIQDLTISLPPVGDYAAGIVFLPNNHEDARRCTKSMEKCAKAEGARVICWRDVPLDCKGLGEFAKSTKPVIRQVFIARESIPAKDFERKLYVIRRLVEKDVESFSGPEAEMFYISSLSSKTIVYKGLLTGTQLADFYSDLADPTFASPYALVHARYSTNTFPTWALAQPFRLAAHNGEINTLRGNINQMNAREDDLISPLFGDDLEKIKPVLNESGSDSAIFDNMAEMLIRAGRSVPHVMMMMVPEGFKEKFIMSADKRAFYEYHSGVLEPWDGPAALMFCDDRYIGATLDRNGLRPARYTITKDGLIVMASETGVLDIPPDRIQKREQLQPGKMFLVDLEQKRVIPDHEIKSKISRAHPYRQWLKQSAIELKGLFQPASAPHITEDRLLTLHHAFGYTEEELKMIIGPMAAWAQEPIGSMGNDTALAVFSEKSPLLFNYFKQLFAQVTNPPIDPLREELVMSLMTWVGTDSNILDLESGRAKRLKLNHPILTPGDLTLIRQNRIPDLRAFDIDMLFDANGGKGALKQGLDELFEKAEAAIAQDVGLLILTDWQINRQQAPIPVLLAAAGLHHHLIRKGLRNRVGIIVETVEAREVGHFALLAGYGVSAICPYGAMATVFEMVRGDFLERDDLDPDHAVDHYITAVKKGLLKTFSRMGISTLRSYSGAQIFQAVGLSKELIDTYFTGTPSPIAGVGLDQIQKETLKRHSRAYPHHGKPSSLLEAGGTYHLRHGGEKHLFSPEAICNLQHAVRTGSYKAFKEYSRIIDDQSKSRATLRSMFQIKPGTPVPIEEVEPVDNIVKRFVTAAMSYGSISKEAHEAIAIAMNRLGGKSNSGEGGEDPRRFKVLKNGDTKRSAIKQIASGRFGVTTEYLMNADELQIKIAQGAKPGEGGQLPGHKVSAEIAKVRHTTQGVTLISPPPHHDIYSIEDLAQLIYDLKCINPAARVSVKLVSEVGVGTIAAGVAKAKADMVLISGHDGGTGASPLTSIMHTGAPWELGLAETQQTLVKNNLRNRVRLQTDGQLKTGRDLAVAALLGADEFGFGTTILVALGCVMMRKCHSDTCPVGVATQNKELRKRFAGKPEHVVNFLRFMATELREYMANCGFKTLDEMIGRADRLEVEPAIKHWKAKGLDLSPILHQPKVDPNAPLSCCEQPPSSIETPMDDELLGLVQGALKNKKPIILHEAIRNIHRTVGARLSGKIVMEHGRKGLPDDTIKIFFTGTAGQSFGAFNAPGLSLNLEGDANDYVGKGMAGGRLVLRPHRDTPFASHENVIIGNTALYGATGGRAYISGIAGMRFAVRNSGAVAVVEGVGRHGCEYMTGGLVVVLGRTGYNFAAGMSGGIAYVYDETELFDTRCNLDMVALETVWTKKDRRTLHKLIEAHYRHTESSRAKYILDNWEACLPLFVKVMPIDYKKALARMRIDEDAIEGSVSATEEVFHG